MTALKNVHPSHRSLTHRWSVGLLDWVVWDGSLTAGTLTIGKVDQGAAGATEWLVSTPGRIQELDYVGGTNAIYIGIATAGSATSAASWQIRKLTYDANNNPTSILYAGGSIAFTAIWDNRAALSYS